jgi:hypothetical protein
MHYKQGKDRPELSLVPLEKRVFIYNALIIIEFLELTFMPTGYFLNSKGRVDVATSKNLEPEYMNDPNVLKNEKYTIGELYDFYKLFRNQKDYTSPVESRFKFGLILKRLDYKKNGWQFISFRKSQAQLVYLSPLLLRVKVPLETRKDYPVGKVDLGEAQVEVTPEDANDVVPEDEKREERFMEVDKEYIEPEEVEEEILENY